MTYASWFQRAVGFIIDGLVVAVPQYVGGLIAVAIGETVGSLVGLVFNLAALGLWIYNRFILGGKTGQSWGRKVMKTKLVSAETGQPIGALNAFVRDLAHIVDALPLYIGFLFPLWDAKRQTLADKIVKTVVVPAAG